MTFNLVGRVKDALENLDDTPWLPRLTKELAEVGWRDLYHDVGISPSSYSTARVMARNASAPRRIVARLPIYLSDDSRSNIFQVEVLDEDYARSYEEAGVRFYTVEEISGVDLREQFGEAIGILTLIPSLCASVATLVRSIHLIDAGDKDYDVSFSEPHIPFTIFMSIPCFRSLTGAFRVAEALVHEAMHLQLTLVEQIVALTNLGDGRYFSPWREEYRASQGVLHAIYVFRVVDKFFEEVISHHYPFGHEGLEYARSRHLEISRQMRDIKSFQDCPELTKLGADVIRQLLRHY